MRLIDADALKEAVSNNPLIDFTDDDIFELIDNAPTVKTYTLEDLEKAKNNGYKWGRIGGMKERPQGEQIAWEQGYECGKNERQQDECKGGEK